MNKKIVIGIAITIIASAIVMVGLKATLGDKATELPGEEHAEKSLNLQETNASAGKPAVSNESGSIESGESIP